MTFDEQASLKTVNHHEAESENAPEARPVDSRQDPQRGEAPSAKGRVALVTGAATRVGRAIALELSSQGMHLAVHYHRHEAEALAVCDLLREQGVLAQPFQADLSSAQARDELLSRVMGTFGALDLLVPSAAIFEQVRIEEIALADWERMLDVNLTATVALAQRAVSHLRARRGNIVFITCSSVEAPYRYHLPYVVSKAGVYQAMRAMALELAPDIRVNAVAPGTVLPPTDMDPEALERLRRRIPLQCFGDPSDIARAVSFLAESPFITGQQIVIDGGRSLGLVPDGS